MPAQIVRAPAPPAAPAVWVNVHVSTKGGFGEMCRHSAITCQSARELRNRDIQNEQLPLSKRRARVEALPQRHGIDTGPLGCGIDQ
jgi:hypothetical protein